MHSFQPSRGRILIEVFCALAVVASMVGAWRQTGASALLVAAAAAGLYAMVRLFDLVRHEPAQAEEPQRIEFEPETHVDIPEYPAASRPLAAVEPAGALPLAAVEPPAPAVAREEPEQVEPAARPGTGRRKGSRKGNGRRAKAPKAVEVVDFAPAEEAEPALPTVPMVEAEAAKLTPADEPSAAVDEPAAEPVHVPHAPLFEPDPYVRMPRQAFGRRGRI